VNGGFDDWKRQGFETESSKDYPEVARGDFKANNEIDKHFISFEEFNKEGGILDNRELANVFDTRVRPQFEGKQETGLNPQCKYLKMFICTFLFLDVSGTRIPNTTNVPSIEFVDRNTGVLKPLKQIQKSNI
jgi:3-mercaptopyruvate sulfurtransferase SseA